MPDELILDASVAAKCFFTEAGSTEARALAVSGVRFLAPDLIFAEIASVAAKRVRRGDIPLDLAADAVAAIAELVDEAVPLQLLAPRAFDLARLHGVSAYDGCYLALAEQTNAQLVTADEKLVSRATAEGLGRWIRPLV